MFAKVFKVRHKMDQRTYALKQSHVSVKRKPILDQFTKEVQIISCLVHENVVKYYTSFVDDKSHFCILMECCRKDLASCFQCQSDRKNLIKPKSVEIFCDIICGLEYIHSRNIIHRDLKPANIFLPYQDSGCQAKIGDFGLSSYEEYSVMSYIGSPRYRAPEQTSGKYDSKVDMYPAGMILFELIKLEWEDPNDETKTWSKVLSDLRSNPNKLLSVFEPFHPHLAKKIIVSLLDVNPKARLSATDVREKLAKLSEDKYVAESKPERNESSGKEVMFLKFLLCFTFHLSTFAMPVVAQIIVTFYYATRPL